MTGQHERARQVPDRVARARRRRGRGGRRCGARRGFLYLLAGERLELAAASSEEPPPPAAHARVEAELLRARRLAQEDDGTTTQAVAFSPADAGPERSVFIEAAPLTTDTSAAGEHAVERVLVLATDRDDRRVVVGGVLVYCDGSRDVAIDADLGEQIAALLHEATSAVSTVVRPSRSLS